MNDEIKEILSLLNSSSWSNEAKQILDLDYEYNKVICNYDGDKFELNIDKWTDYEGEQLQVKSNGKTYLLSANKCYLIKEN